MKKTTLIITVILLLCYFMACKEREGLYYYDINAPVPAQIDKNSIIVSDSAGYSIIRFHAPDDDNFLCVRAEYETSPGVLRETKASRYIDTLVVEGFAAEGNYPVKLYSVGKNEKESNPIEITVGPHTPPVVESFPSLELVQTFGGVSGSFNNPHGTNLTAVLMADTAHNGNHELMQSFAIKNYNARFSFLGLDSVETDFSVYLKDRWGNRSESKYFTLKPLYEIEIDKTKWKRYELPSDHLDPSENAPNRYRFEGAWDGITTVQYYNVFMCSPTPFPATFTIDLGQTVTISRIKVYQWYLIEYQYHNMKSFEFWGSNSDNPGDDLMGGDWNLLGKFRSYKPSGDTGPVTQEDREYGQAGENHILSITDDVPNPYVPVRFFRIRAFENWLGITAPESGLICIPEITIYGQPQEKK